METERNLASTLDVNISQVLNHDTKIQQDTLAVEEPLEIRLEFGEEKKQIKKTISITMRTPGSDFELAAGFLFTEGVLKKRADLKTVAFCGPTKNVVRIELKPEIKFDLKKLERHFYTSSSCGVCGKTSIEALKVQTEEAFAPSALPFKVSHQVIHSLPAKLRETQSLFNSTGGIHGCAVFDTNGNLLAAREDVGRHNALDKLIGFYFLHDKLPLDDHILLVSGRASFELVQKASMAGFNFFVAVGAPSSLAVELAKESRMTLLGFVRDERFNIYSGEERVTPNEITN